MSRRVAIFGGSFNPPGWHHRRIAEALAREFDEVIVVPCGPRPDKQTTNDVEPIFRATMTDIAFRGIENLRVELFDVENATFTRTYQLQERFAAEGELFHVVGTDLTSGGSLGKSYIQNYWDHGNEIWQQFKFVVISRKGFSCQIGDLPPDHLLIDLECEGSSSQIREHIFKRLPFTDLVCPEIERYIERYGLYRGRIPNRATKFILEEPRLLVVYDEKNPRAIEWARKFEQFTDPANPNCILVLGGDGMMLRAIRENWRMRLPFFGINAGHLGFLLNKAEEVLAAPFPPHDLILRQLPLIYVEIENRAGERHSALSFNDAWVERASSQSAWIEVTLNGQVRLPKLISDGVLLATAAGSTAYARAMGATPLLVDTPALILVGSNVMYPANWRSALLTYDSHVEFNCLDPVKRPLVGYVDGLWQGDVQRFRARVSRIAAAELAFCPDHDMAEKIAQIQFPQSEQIW